MFNTISKFIYRYVWWLFAVQLVCTFVLLLKLGSINLNSDLPFLFPSKEKVVFKDSLINIYENKSKLFLVAQGPEEKLVSFANDIEKLLEAFKDLVTAVYSQLPIEFLRNNSIKLMSKDNLDKFGFIFNDPNLIPFLSNLNNYIEEVYQTQEGILDSYGNINNAISLLERIESFVDIQGHIMDGEKNKNIGQDAVDAILIGDKYIFSKDKSMILILIEPAFNMYDHTTESFEKIQILKDIVNQYSTNYGVKSSLAGIPTYYNFINIFLINDAIYIFIFLCLAILVSILLSYQNIKNIFLIIISILISSIWLMGISTIIIKELNIILLFFIIFFIAQSVFNSISFILEYSDNRNQLSDLVSSINKTFVFIYPMLLRGLLLNILAFFAFTIFKTQSLSDMAFIALLGSIFNFFIIFSILPNLIVIVDFLIPFNFYNYKNKTSFHFLDKMVLFINKYRKIIFISYIIISLFFIYRSNNLLFDYDYTNYNKNYNSIGHQNIVNNFDFSIDNVLLVSNDLYEIQSIVKKARNYEIIGWIESVSDYTPDYLTTQTHFHFLSSLSRNLKNRKIRKQISSYDMELYKKEITRLEANIIELQYLALLEGKDKLYDQASILVGEAEDNIPIGTLTKYIDLMSTELSRTELAYSQQEFANKFKSSILEMVDREPLSFENLPGKIKKRFTNGIKGPFIINIYPKKIPWKDIEYLYDFNDFLSSLSINKIGNLPLFIDIVNLFDNNIKMISLFLIVFSIIIFILDFKSVKLAFFGVLMIVFTIFWILGIMELVGLKFNVYNMFPIIFVCFTSIINLMNIYNYSILDNNMKFIYIKFIKMNIISSMTIVILYLILSYYLSSGFDPMVNILLFGLINSFIIPLIVFAPFLKYKRISL